jgi:cytidyltransferase-like protein
MSKIITSGFFNPLHIGHTNLIKEAKKLGVFLLFLAINPQAGFPFRDLWIQSKPGGGTLWVWRK